MKTTNLASLNTVVMSSNTGRDYEEWKANAQTSLYQKCSPTSNQRNADHLSLHSTDLLFAFIGIALSTDLLFAFLGISLTGDLGLM